MASTVSYVSIAPRPYFFGSKPKSAPQTSNFQSEKTTGADIYFRGGAEHSTDKALKLIESGETAGNALILVLKNSEFDKEISKTLLHSLEGAVPFLNLATKAPSLFNRFNQLLTKKYKEDVKHRLVDCLVNQFT